MPDAKSRMHSLTCASCARTLTASASSGSSTSPVLAARTRVALAEFASLVRRLRSRIGVLPLPELLDDVLEASGYRAMLADGSEDGEERWANLLELREVTTRYDDCSRKRPSSPTRMPTRATPTPSP